MKYNKKEDNIIMNLLCFGLGMFATYFIICLFGGRILSSLEYANYKTLDYKQEVIQAYRKNLKTTFSILRNTKMGEEQWDAYHKSIKELQQVLNKEDTVD